MPREGQVVCPCAFREGFLEEPRLSWILEKELARVRLREVGWQERAGEC